MEVQIVSGKESTNRVHLTSSDVVDAIIIFGDVADKTEILWQHAVPLSF